MTTLPKYLRRSREGSFTTLTHLILTDLSQSASNLVLSHYTTLLYSDNCGTASGCLMFTLP